jgi:methylated-DNA-[protein]-cysteine S-methyltransferase
MYYTYIESPIGRLLLAGEIGRLRLIGFPVGPMARGADPDWARSAAPFRDAIRQLTEYFAGERRVFDLPLDPQVTDFQRRVLAALQAIPYGETRSYKDIAIAVGNPRAVRAVGGANAANPLPIVIPCHRVIGSGGDLTGFGGGMPIKRYLLDLELRHSGLFGN